MSSPRLITEVAYQSSYFFDHSKTQSSSYYTSFPSTSTASGPTSAPQQPAAQPAPQRSTSQDETSPFLRDFNLVAEAAKRAQMAVLMRDLEGIGLQ
ncbi:thiol methyltransferase protein [Rutstroemia sp. NJR-2017a BVV2]|nr:thiol methyltransferase protein [Rutstroemia sp. NJR-2017a BVV2]